MKYGPKPQYVGDRCPDRKDHVWSVQADRMKCVLCGAVAAKVPAYPTPPDWMPEMFEALTPQERALSPRLAMLAVLPFGLSLEWLLIYVVMVAAGIALVFLAFRVFGWAPPPWVVQAFWIVLAAFVIILCIRLVFSM